MYRKNADEMFCKEKKKDWWIVQSSSFHCLIKGVTAT